MLCEDGGWGGDVPYGDALVMMSSSRICIYLHTLYIGVHT
jgi:hypothetical protein